MADDGKKRVKQAVARSQERALKEERLGLAIIATAFVQEANDAGRLLTRLETIVRKAEADPRTPVAVRRALLDGALMVRTAIEREAGKPQSLLDPHIGHVSPAAVVKLADVENGDGAVQLGLDAGTGLEDAQGAHAERTRTLQQVHAAIVIAARQGAATDAELYRRYLELKGVPHQSEKALRDRRIELTKTGRLVSSGSKHKGETMWQLVEARAA